MFSIGFYFIVFIELLVVLVVFCRVSFFECEKYFFVVRESLEFGR